MSTNKETTEQESSFLDGDTEQPIPPSEIVAYNELPNLTEKERSHGVTLSARDRHVLARHQKSGQTATKNRALGGAQ